MAEMIESATPSARELRRRARLATKGCQKELMTLSVTMKKPWKVNKKPGKVNKVSASTEEKHSSASTEKHFDRDSNSENITEANNSLGYAQSDLKLYQKINEWEDTLFDFESIEILSFKKSRLFQLGSNCTEFWKHVCFTAKPENGDASPKYFLVEVKKGPEGRWKARRCWMFEPKDDAGMDHGCIICTNDQKIHPVAGQYHAGHTLTCRDATRGFQKELITPREQSSTSNEKHFYTDSITKFLKNSEHVTRALLNNLRLSFADACSGLKLYNRINKDTLFDDKSIEILTFKGLTLIQLGRKRTEFWVGSVLSFGSIAASLLNM